MNSALLGCFRVILNIILGASDYIFPKLGRKVIYQGAIAYVIIMISLVTVIKALGEFIVKFLGYYKNCFEIFYILLYTFIYQQMFKESSNLSLLQLLVYLPLLFVLNSSW